MREEGVAVRAGPSAVDVRMGVRGHGGIEFADDRLRIGATQITDEPGRRAEPFRIRGARIRHRNCRAARSRVPADDFVSRVVVRAGRFRREPGMDGERAPPAEGVAGVGLDHGVRGRLAGSGARPTERWVAVRQSPDVARPNASVSIGIATSSAKNDAWPSAECSPSAGSASLAGRSTERPCGELDCSQPAVTRSAPSAASKDAARTRHTMPERRGCAARQSLSAKRKSR